MPRAQVSVEKVSARQAIVATLGDGQKKASDIITAVIANEGVTLGGKTPAATISSVLTTEAKKDNGLWVKVETGIYKLRAA